MKNFTISKGFSLIEVMIAIVISTILMLGATGLFISNKRIYKEQDAIGRLQENARFAMEMLIRDIRRVGYVGCSDEPAQVTNQLTPIAAVNLLNFTNPVEGSENANNWVPSASTEIIGNILPAGTMQTRPDAITVRFLEPINPILLQMTGEVEGTDAIPVTCPPVDANCTTNPPVLVNDNIAISDCASTDIIKITGVNAASLAHGVTLSRKYPDTSQLSRYVTHRYYIGAGGNDNLGNAIPSLFRQTYASGSPTTVQLLIEGVESMQFLYGVDNDNDSIADTYANAAGVGAANWDNVVSVRIALLVRTVQPDFSQEKDLRAYSLLGIPVYTTAAPPNDNFRRRVFSTTVQIRNRQ